MLASVPMAVTASRHRVRSAADPRPTSVVPFPGSWSATHDPRWPAIADALEELRERGRQAIRIVDADCGAGSLLLHALHHARALGFTAIEGLGIDGSPALVGRARAAASRAPDAGIGVVFEVDDVVASLERESEFPADILLWHGSRSEDHAIIGELHRAGNLVIGDEDRVNSAMPEA